MKLGIFLLCAALGALSIYLIKKMWQAKAAALCCLVTSVTTPADIPTLFATTAEDIQHKTDTYMHSAQKALAELIALDDNTRTFANTAHALDTITGSSECAIFHAIVSGLELVSPEESVRTAAHTAVSALNNFWVDQVSNNEQVYRSFKAYVDGNAHHEQLNDEQRLYLEKTMADFKRSGFDLAPESRERVGQLKKDLAKLAQDFEKNIAQNANHITVTLAGLEGLDADFIASLKREGNEYVLGVDYPTYHNVMDNCSVTDTRKRLYDAFVNRAHPANEALLQEVIAKRDELAQLLGFESYAHFDLDDQMVGSVQKAHHFLADLRTKAADKELQEFTLYTQDLPPSVTLTPEGKLQPWDTGYVKATYKKKHLALDERDVARYFPMEKTVEGLLAIYEQFFNIVCTQIPAQGLWHPDVRLLSVADSDGTVLGYLLLDLYPRADKYSHACFHTIIPALATSNTPALGLVIANFTKPTADKPSLLTRSDVSTFFHEFGHALHGIFGRTHMAKFSGCNTQWDFVEMPSQMLEEWLWDTAILKELSSHYQTGEQLPDALIATMQKTKNLDTGNFVQTQLVYGLLSLAYFDRGQSKDISGLAHALLATLRPHVQLSTNNHFYSSFGHLMGYGAKYYGYLWSKVFALDLFETVKKEGLRNPAIGTRYRQQILAHGGSKDPNGMLTNFLGRAPNQDAFLRDLGLETSTPSTIYDAHQTSSSTYGEPQL